MFNMLNGKLTASIGLFILLSGCTIVPKSAIDRDEKGITKLSEFELCRAYLSFELTDRQIERSAIPQELRSRELTGLDCFDVLIAEHGVESFCSNYNSAVGRGEPYASIGLATDLSRPMLEAGFQARNIDCYTDEYLSKSAQRRARSDRSADRVNRFFDSLEESFEAPETTTTRCKETVYGDITCRETKY